MIWDGENGTKRVLCLHCGAPEMVDLFEYYPEEPNGGAFQLETCCAELYESIIEEMNNDPKYGAQLLTHIGAADLIGDGEKLRRVVGIDGGLRLDWNPELREIGQKQAFAFIEEHHAHNGKLPGWRFGAGIWNGAQLIGVIVVGNPTARAYNGQCLEVRRLCLRRDIAGEFRWNACSMAYGWAARKAEQLGYPKIITYTLESELGTTLKAAGWVIEGKTKGGSWDTPARRRIDTAPTCPKVRWSRGLRPMQQLLEAA